MSDLRTNSKIVTATLGQLVVEARAAGITPYMDGGKKTYNMVIDKDAGRVKIGRTKVENNQAALKLSQLVLAALATGVKPRKDAKGNEYVTLDFDLDKGLVEVVATSEQQLKIGKAITPSRGKR